MNGAKKEDKEEEVTFIGGREEMVIDYVLGDRMAWKRTKIGGRRGDRFRSLSCDDMVRERNKGRKARRREEGGEGRGDEESLIGRGGNEV